MAGAIQAVASERCVMRSESRIPALMIRRSRTRRFEKKLDELKCSGCGARAGRKWNVNQNCFHARKRGMKTYWYASPSMYSASRMSGCDASVNRPE